MSGISYGAEFRVVMGIKTWGMFIAAALLALALPRPLANAALSETPASTDQTGLELVIAEIEGCTYCDVFRRDILPDYQKSQLSKTVPIRFVDLNSPDAARLDLVAGPVTVVPTVILARHNRELDRAAGYLGPENFAHVVDAMLARAD